jgi:hypothetical protein
MAMQAIGYLGRWVGNFHRLDFVTIAPVSSPTRPTPEPETDVHSLDC